MYIVYVLESISHGHDHWHVQYGERRMLSIAAYDPGMEDLGVAGLQFDVSFLRQNRDGRYALLQGIASFDGNTPLIEDVSAGTVMRVKSDFEHGRIDREMRAAGVRGINITDWRDVLATKPPPNPEDLDKFSRKVREINARGVKVFGEAEIQLLLNP